MDASRVAWVLCPPAGPYGCADSWRLIKLTQYDVVLFLLSRQRRHELWQISRRLQIVSSLMVTKVYF